MYRRMYRILPPFQNLSAFSRFTQKLSKWSCSEIHCSLIPIERAFSSAVHNNIILCRSSDIHWLLHRKRSKVPGDMGGSCAMNMVRRACVIPLTMEWACLHLRSVFCCSLAYPKLFLEHGSREIPQIFAVLIAQNLKIGAFNDGNLLPVWESY